MAEGMGHKKYHELAGQEQPHFGNALGVLHHAACMLAVVELEGLAPVPPASTPAQE